MDTADIRNRFVDYFQGHGYCLLPKAPLVDPDTSMSFVMSAGLVQVERMLPSLLHRSHNRFVLVQECYRYFDLDKVGTDDLHLTFFEMPGAFIFGPSSRSQAVQKMWQLVTAVLCIPREHIWATYFGGGTVLNQPIPEDSETRQAWHETGIAPGHIVGLKPPDNYWLQGTGGRVERTGDPRLIRRCGPNTELFYDRGPEFGCSPHCRPGCRCGRFVEFANSLFINGIQNLCACQITPNPDPFTETVIGLERVAMILQEKRSVFEIDSLAPLTTLIRGFVPASACLQPQYERYIGAIADHIRALFALMRDGAPPPGKNGQERLIKKLIRRTVTLCILLDIPADHLIEAVLEQVLALSAPDENNWKGYEASRECFQKEQCRFLATVERGRRRMEKMLAENGGETISAAQRVELEKIVGYPELLINRTLQQKCLVREADI